MVKRILKTPLNFFHNTEQNVKFFIKDFFTKCDQIHRKLRIWPHLLKKSLMENFIFLQCKRRCSDGFLADYVPLYFWEFDVMFIRYTLVFIQFHNADHLS